MHSGTYFIGRVESLQFGNSVNYCNYHASYASYTPFLRKRTYANHHIAANPSTVTTVGTTRDL